jgi:hypothetical protein
MSEDRGGWLSAGGILSIIVGAFEIIGGGALVVWGIVGCVPFWESLCSLPPHYGGDLSMHIFPMWIIIGGGILVALGIIAIAGGTSAVKRRSFGLSLAGAICAFIPFNILGLLAIIFVSLGKREF